MRQAKSLPTQSASVAGRPFVKLFYIVFCALATLQLLRSYFIVDSPYLDATRYETGSERMPYQARILMSVIMQHANESHLIARMSGMMRGVLHSPDVFSVFLVDLLSLVTIAFVARALYLRAMPHGRLAWLPYPLVLVIMAEIYIVRFQQAIYFPYDMLSAALFTLCVYLAYTRRYLVFIAVFILACFTRETIILAIPLLLLNISTLPKLTRDSWKELGTAALCAIIWFTIFHHLNHLYDHNASESFSRVHANLGTLKNPLQWSQVASGGGFLLFVPFLFWKQMPDERLRRYSLLIPIWIAIIFCVGLIGESRVFGELTALLAVYCTILFESIYVTPDA